jgi:hypothetical protein
MTSDAQPCAFFFRARRGRVGVPAAPRRRRRLRRHGAPRVPRRLVAPAAIDSLSHARAGCRRMRRRHRRRRRRWACLAAAARGAPRRLRRRVSVSAATSPPCAPTLPPLVALRAPAASATSSTPSPRRHVCGGGAEGYRRDTDEMTEGRRADSNDLAACTPRLHDVSMILPCGSRAFMPVTGCEPLLTARCLNGITCGVMNDAMRCNNAIVSLAISHERSERRSGKLL